MYNIHFGGNVMTQSDKYINIYERIRKINYVRPKNDFLCSECVSTINCFALEDINTLLISFIDIIGFCETEEDFSEVNAFFYSIASIGGFAKDFYEKYAFLINYDGKKLIDGVIDSYDYGSIIKKFNNEVSKNRKLCKSKI